MESEDVCMICSIRSDLISILGFINAIAEVAIDRALEERDSHL